MPRKVVRKERGVFEKVPGSGIWWIRFKVKGVEHREKVGRRGDAMKLYAMRRADVVRGVKMPANMKHKGVKISEIAQEAIDEESLQECFLGEHSRSRSPTAR